MFYVLMLFTVLEQWLNQELGYFYEMPYPAGREIWKMSGLWIRKVDECIKQVLMRHFIRSLGDSSAESIVEYTGSGQKVSEVDEPLLFITVYCN